MKKAERAKIKRLALHVSRTAFAEGVADAGVGDGPELDRRRRASRLALDALLAALAEIDVEPDAPELQWRVRDTAWGGDRMGAEDLMRRYQQTHSGVLEYRRKAGPWTDPAELAEEFARRES